jgi:NitT/TauT family transport system permease protein
LEVILGLVIGTILALFSGYFLAHNPIIEKIMFPYIIASQAIPMAAIAPLLVIWFGSGITPKILICTLVVFFPIQINVIIGLREIPRNLRDLMKSMQANPKAVFKYLELPGALPVIFGGLRISATLSVIGAVVGELTGADAGLGYLINTARGQYDTAMVFVAVLMLMAIALFLYLLIVLIERYTLKWQSAK